MSGIVIPYFLAKMGFRSVFTGKSGHFHRGINGKSSRIRLKGSEAAKYAKHAKRDLKKLGILQEAAEVAEG